MFMYATRDVTTRFGVSRQTVRVWALEFENNLSPTANPEKGRQRNFTDDDLQVFALIAEMKEKGATFEEIHAALASGQRGNIPTLPETAITPKQSAQVTQLEIQIVDLEGKLQAAHNELLRKDGEVAAYKSQVERYEKRLDELNREIGRLQAKLDDGD